VQGGADHFYFRVKTSVQKLQLSRGEKKGSSGEAQAEEKKSGRRNQETQDKLGWETIESRGEGNKKLLGLQEKEGIGGIASKSEGQFERSLYCRERWGGKQTEGWGEGGGQGSDCQGNGDNLGEHRSESKEHGSGGESKSFCRAEEGRQRKDLYTT